MNQRKFIIIGAAIMDILARPVDASVFTSGSLPAGAIAMHAWIRQHADLENAW